MHTLRLKINDKIFDKLVWLLGKFSKNELEIINEDNEFFENQIYLEKELKEIVSLVPTLLRGECLTRRSASNNGGTVINWT